ncbi:MAG: transglutaminase domain-containing protein [Chloroflexi bacterium]|nr:transglutaminase domain-containing protein [Chloroflexota bacterium]
MNHEYMLLTGALRVFQDFSSSNVKELSFVYDFNNEYFNLLKHKYPIIDIAGKGDDLSKALNLMRWVYNNTWHNGDKDFSFLKPNSISILDYCFGKGPEFAINCFLHAVIFTECCLAIGLKARTISCLPFSPYDFDNHVVSMVFMPSLKKWVMLDPDTNAYFLDPNGNILSPWEARQILAANGEITVNTDIDTKSNKSLRAKSFRAKTGEYKEYMAKNLFYIACSRINTFGTNRTNLGASQETLYLAPKGFNIAERELANRQYRVENSPPEYKKMLERTKKDIIVEKLLISLEQFMRE